MKHEDELKALKEQFTKREAYLNQKKKRLEAIHKKRENEKRDKK
jgi:hypothetical protein